MVLSVILPCEERLRRTVLPEAAERLREELDAERPTDEAERLMPELAAERLTPDAAPERAAVPEPATVLLIRPFAAPRVMAPTPERATDDLPIPMPWPAALPPWILEPAPPPPAKNSLREPQLCGPSKWSCRIGIGPGP